MNAGLGTITGIALAVAAWLWWHRSAPKFTTLLALVAGIGIGGLAAQLVSTLLGTVVDVPGHLLGLGTAGLLAGLALVATLEVVFKGMWGKKAKPKRWHPILALVLPTIVVAGGIPLLGQLMTALAGGMADVGRAVLGG